MRIGRDRIGSGSLVDTGTVRHVRCMANCPAVGRYSYGDRSRVQLVPGLTVLGCSRSRQNLVETKAVFQEVGH